MDITTIQAQMDLLIKNGHDLNKVMTEKMQQVSELQRKLNDLTIQIEQHRGALTYNQALYQQMLAQVETLNKTTTASPTPPTCPS